MNYGTPIRTVAPTALPVSIAELKAHLRLDGVNGDSEDAYLAGLIRVGTEYAEQETGLGLITQTWTQTFSEFPGTKYPNFLQLRRRPLQAVVSIEYLDSVGSPASTTVLDPSVYRVHGIGADMPPGGTISLAQGGVWPTILTDDEAVTVNFRVGFGDDHNAVPERIRHAIMDVAATLHAFREDVMMGSTVSAELPMSSKILLRPWKPLAVA